MRARVVAFVAFAAVGLVFAIVNALSELDERSRLGLSVESWEPWVWELSSLASFLLLAPLVLRLSQRLVPSRFSWAAIAAGHIAAAIAISLLHSLIMIGIREAIYAAVGADYASAGPLPGVLVYEFRKDLITYAALAVLPHIAWRLIESRSLGAMDRRRKHRIEVRDGSRTVWLAPDDVDWAQAAGNYVELHGRFGNMLHRRTLAALETELEPFGFVRIHRSRIVRSGAIASVETKPSGDFDVELSGGGKLGGSRRFRANLA